MMDDGGHKKKQLDPSKGIQESDGTNWATAVSDRLRGDELIPLAALGVTSMLSHDALWATLGFSASKQRRVMERRVKPL